MKRKKKIWLYVIIGIIFLIGGMAMLGGKGKTEKLPYMTAPVEKETIVRTVSATGSLESIGSYDLAFETGGRVDSVYVNVGDEVEKGDIVAELDSSILRSQIAQARYDIQVQQSQLDLMRRTWDDYKPEEKDSQKALVDRAKVSLGIYQKQLAKTYLKSPVDGIITRSEIREGEIANANMPVFEVIKGDDLVLESNISESDIVNVEIGDPAVVTFDALSIDEEFEAEVKEIEPSATVIQDVVYYKVTLGMKVDDPRLRSGMSVSIDIKTAEKNNVLAIPLRAVNAKDDGSRYVEKVQADGTLKKIEITTGMEADGGVVEVVSGLSEGDEIVTYKEK